MTDMHAFPVAALVLGAFAAAVAFAADGGGGGRTQRQVLLDAMKQRPGDPWPRGTGHVLLAEPGSPRTQKAYHEPGGGFSPAPGSFGVSVWVLGEDADILTTGETIALESIRQRYDWSGEANIPAILTETDHYRARWSCESPGRWRLNLRGAGEPRRDLAVLIRGPGPAGGGVKAIRFDGGALLIDHRWVLTPRPLPEAVHLGTEAEKGWTRAAPARRAVTDDEGWCYARLVLPGGTDLELSIRDTQPQFASPLAFADTRSTVSCDLPDERFEASLEAQVANLMMGCVGRQTRPGEPTNYPLAWERDGACSVVAMARCGRLETARDLSIYFAENDFFGGFGAEGDAPGSAIGALADVAALLRDPGFDRFIWPHVRRKAAIIHEMLHAAAPVEKQWVGPVLANVAEPHVICKAAKDGVIYGSMDHHYPALYINAVSYRGMSRAAGLADRLGRAERARAYRRTAETIRQGWRRAFHTGEAGNPRTYISGIWPTWVVGPDFQPYADALGRRGFAAGESLAHRPKWTYFTVAEAHQWLFLRRPEIVWRALRYFWANQCSPGLYTYWEGDGEENSFGIWPRYRGWVRPPHVTPHYWTAAEMLLLQLDMLACVDESAREPTLVLGAGVPKDWARRPMRVDGLHTSLGRVAWRYDGRAEVTVTIAPRRTCHIRLGPSFPEHVKVTVNP